MKIGFEFSGKQYTLEYCKASIRRLEAEGHKLTNVENAPISFGDILFYGALIKNQPEITIEQADAIYPAIMDDELVKKIIEMFADAAKVGVYKEKNAKWKVIG